MLPGRGRALCGRGLSSRLGAARRSCSQPACPAHRPPCSKQRARPWPRPASRAGRGRLQRAMKAGGTSSLGVCLVCGLASQPPSLIAGERSSFAFKESNHCSCYEAKMWKAFVDFVLKESSVPFHTSLSHCVTFSVLSFFFFSLEHMAQWNDKYSSPHLARRVLPHEARLWKMLCPLRSGPTSAPPRVSLLRVNHISKENLRSECLWLSRPRCVILGLHLIQDLELRPRWWLTSNIFFRLCVAPVSVLLRLLPSVF